MSPGQPGLQSEILSLKGGGGWRGRSCQGDNSVGETLVECAGHGGLTFLILALESEDTPRCRTLWPFCLA